jgi:predicted phage terminase large subunit-like protein
MATKAGAKGKRVWWVGPTYSIARLGWREAKFLASQIPGSIPHKGSLTIDFSSGGMIAFRSSDVPENLRGEGLDLLIMDEADFQPEEVWSEVLRPALADRKGAAIFISTPNIEGGWFNRIYLSGQLGNPDNVPYLNKPNASADNIKSWQFSSYTNPYLDYKEIEKAKEELPSIIFRREFLAEFVSVVGARVKREWLKYVDNIPSNLTVSMGVDLAISEKASADYTAIVVLGRDPTGILYVLDAQRIRASFAEQIIFIKQTADKWKPEIIAVEDVGYQRSIIQTLNHQTSLNVHGVRPDRDKIARFSPLEARFEQGQIYLNRNLPIPFEAELLSFPVAEHDDFCDAFGYAWLAYDLIRKDEIISIPQMPIVGRRYVSAY